MTSLISRPELIIADDYVKEEPKLCKDCYHIATNSSREWEKYRCMAPENNTGINLVTGDPVYAKAFCIDVRSTDIETWCGKEGRWWKPKPEVKVPAPGNLEPTNLSAVDLDSLADKAAERVANLRKKKLSASDLSNL